MRERLHYVRRLFLIQVLSSLRVEIHTYSILCCIYGNNSKVGISLVLINFPRPSEAKSLTVCVGLLHGKHSCSTV